MPAGLPFAIITASVIIAAALVAPNIYYISTPHGPERLPRIFRLNRITGAMSTCDAVSCESVIERK